MTRTDLLAEIERAHADLVSALGELGERRTPDAELTGARADELVWTTKELLGHVAMWKRVALKFIAEFRRSGVPTPLGLKDDAAVNEFNARGAASRRDQPLAAVQSEFDAAHSELLAAVNELSDADLARPLPSPWPAGANLAHLIAINSSEHEPEHTEQIRGWLKDPTHA